MKRNKLIGAAVAAVAVVAGVSASVSVADTRSDDGALRRNLETFNAIVKELSLNYPDSIRPDKAFGEAIDALLGTVDPYTEYYTTDEQEALVKMTTGDYGGIGSYIMERDGSTYLSGPMEGSPAMEADMRAGDKVIRVDTVNTVGMSSDKVSKLLRGTPGTPVRVEVLRPFATDSVLTFNIERRKLHQPSVAYSGVVKDSTGYILLTSFIDKSPEEVRAALEEFKANPAVRQVVLDLRGNGGGLLESAVEIAGMFLPKGTEVLRTRSKNGEKIYKTTKNPIYPDIPLAILIDGGTASSSEIVAGAMQDLDRAVLVGTRSFGKGLVQSTRPLPNQGVLKVTVAKYYTPSGRLIQALDYAKRNEDGSVQRVPDSLTHVYKTLHGREMRDGGGLAPDSVVEYDKINRIVYNVVRDNWAFDFATRWRATHDTVAKPEVFEITDEMYSDFKRGIDPARFKYDRVMEEAMSQLREIARSEGYMDTETEAAFDSLSTLLTHDLNRDLDTNREKISEYLAAELLSRYYHDRGKIAYTLRDDKGLETALSILRDPHRYKTLLHIK